jgi:hypothetical protein
MGLFSYLWQLASDFFAWLFSLPLQLVSEAGRFWGLSLPARVAIVTALTLVTAVLTIVIANVIRNSMPELFRQYGWQAGLAVGVLLLLIPLLTYHAVRLWLEGDPARFPDIEAAFAAGLDAMQEVGLDFRNLPVFLVLGVPDEKQSQLLAHASGLKFDKGNVPPGPAPLKWYIGNDAVYLVCCDASQLARLSTMRSRAPSSVGPGGGRAAAGGGPSQTYVPANFDDLATVREDDIKALAPKAPAPAPPAPVGRQIGAGATYVADSGDEPGAPAKPAEGPQMLSLPQSTELSERLKHVASLLLKHRSPVCPVNGILVILPYGLFEQGAGLATQRALVDDLNALRESLQLRCAVTCVMSELDKQPGFLEMVRRLGPENTKEQRFGKGYDPQSLPLPEHVSAVAAHGLAAFEDAVYRLFRDRENFGRIANRKLYQMLCQVRMHFRMRIAKLAEVAFSCDEDELTRNEKNYFRFAGLYFAATGSQEDRQAFLKSALQRPLSYDSVVEWAPQAVAEDAAYHNLARGVLLLDGVLLLGIVGLVIFRMLAP